LTAITNGSAYRSIAHLAREHKLDVVITSRGNRTPSGLDVDGMLSRLSCPVISVPVGSYGLAVSNAAHARLYTAGRRTAQATPRIARG
jgi:hypothetical protein